MDLYFSPLACSLATRISLYEAGTSAHFIAVDGKTKQTEDGSSFLDINPLGLVPVLRTDEAELLTENAAILQYIADRYPEAELAPRCGFAVRELQKWLSFIGTELHKALFAPLLDKTAPEPVRAYSLAKAPSRLAVLERHLQSRDYLLDRFSVADAYLFAVLNWSFVTPIKLSEWPTVHAYYKRLTERPSIARALHEEAELYKAEQAHPQPTASPLR
jgi:glutathione S-transferase